MLRTEMMQRQINVTSNPVSTTAVERKKKRPQGGCRLCSLCCVINVALNSPIKVTDDSVYH